MSKEAKTKEAKPVEAASQPEKLFPVVLKKNYMPTCVYEIVGYLKPKVERKDSAGKMLVVEPEEFIAGEPHPAPYPGTGYPGKLWAGTHVRLPIDEAKKLVASKAAERADVIAA